MINLNKNKKSLNEKTIYWLPLLFFSISLIILLLNLFFDGVSVEFLVIIVTVQWKFKKVEKIKRN